MSAFWPYSQVARWADEQRIRDEEARLVFAVQAAGWRIERIPHLSEGNPARTLISPTGGKYGMFDSPFKAALAADRMMKLVV